MTVIFSFSAIARRSRGAEWFQRMGSPAALRPGWCRYLGANSFADNLDFRFQLNAALGPCPVPDDLDQFQYVPRAGRAVVHNKIPMLGRDIGTPYPCEFQAQLLDQFACWNRSRIFKDAAGAQRR